MAISKMVLRIDLGTVDNENHKTGKLIFSFGWDHNVKSCVRFSYYGRDGNYNNFPNFPSCVAYCKDSKKVDTSG